MLCFSVNVETTNHMFSIKELLKPRKHSIYWIK